MLCKSYCTDPDCFGGYLESGGRGGRGQCREIQCYMQCSYTWLASGDVVQGQVTYTCFYSVTFKRLFLDWYSLCLTWTPLPALNRA